MRSRLGPTRSLSTKSADTLKSFADVKGKTLGLTGLGSSTSFLTQYLAAQHGITSKEYTMLPVGADASFIAAINQSRIDAGLTTEPSVSVPTAIAAKLAEAAAPDPLLDPQGLRSSA